MEKLKNSLSVIAVLVGAGVFIFVINEIETRFFWWFVPAVLIAIWFLRRYAWSFLGAILFSVAAGEVDVTLQEKQLVLWAIVICGAIQVLIALFENLIQNRVSQEQDISSPSLGRNALFGFFGLAIAYALINPSCPSVVIPSDLIATLSTKTLEQVPRIEVYVISSYCIGNSFLKPIMNLLSSSGANPSQGILLLLSVFTGMWPFLITSLFAALSQTLPPHFTMKRLLIQTIKALGGMILISFPIIFILSIFWLFGSGLFYVHLLAVSDQPVIPEALLFRIFDYEVIIAFAVSILLYAFGAGWGARWWIHKWKDVDQVPEEKDDLSDIDESIGSEITSDSEVVE
jgi:hypothetical protein